MPGEARVRRVAWTSLALAAAAALVTLAVVHGPRIVRNFSVVHWEDEAFFRYDAERIHSLPECFVKPGLWPGLYRPLTTNCYYHVGSFFFGRRVEPYHVANVVFLITNGVLVFLLGTRRLPGRWALAPTVLFVGTLAHAELVEHTCEAQALVSLSFLLVAVDRFAAGRPRDDVLVGVAFVLALLSKESAIALPAVLLAWAWFDARPIPWRRLAGPTLVALVWATTFAVLRRRGGAAGTGFSYDFSLRNVAANYAWHFLDFFNGVTYALESRDGAWVDALTTSPAVTALFLVALVAVAALVAVQRRLPEPVRLVALGLTVFFVLEAPFAILGDRRFMRYSYAGHVGLALACGALVRAAGERLRGLRRYIAPL